MTVTDNMTLMETTLVSETELLTVSNAGHRPPPKQCGLWT